MFEANLQAVRDAAVAVNTCTCFFQRASHHNDFMPSPESTAVATLCVDSHSFELRLHWRHEQTTSYGNKVSWEVSKHYHPFTRSKLILATSDESAR